MWVRSFSYKIIDVSLIFYYQYYSTYCESLFLVWCFSSILQVRKILKNYRLVANLSFISSFFFEKAIATQIQSHLISNDSVDNFQSAYKAGHP